ncbi:hypothetical protein [Chryseobacterium oryctis]|uniref:C1q domain-containing protein n=1 Tax=Chryseobacterium oryctis TaxID=2952618 RepID=A0ABT3HMV9_9FLAO|nr:hypothetical protein [Chryseobacterium oryctis]MCW3161124.1 hypothetical protein [Chryseobacterium oryctis]
MKSYIIGLFLFLLPSYFYSQIGVNTDTPLATAHVNGGLQVTKELSVGGNASVYGDVGRTNDVLMSNGTGNAPHWQKIEDLEIVPLIAGLGMKKSLSPSAAGGASYTAKTRTTVKFETTPKVKSAYLTYNTTTGEYTVNKAGFYKIIGYLGYNLEDNPTNTTHGTAITEILKNNTETVAAYSTYHHEISDWVGHSVSGTAYFSVGDKITISGSHTQKYKFEKASISILFTGNS